MMNHPTTREDFTGALRALADWLDTNPNIPHPKYGTDIQHSIITADDTEGMDALYTAAEAFFTADGPTVELTHGGEGRHAVTAQFGPITYLASYIDAERMARHAAAKATP